MNRRTSGFALAMMVVLLGAGCFSYSPTSRDRPRVVQSPTKAPAWPEWDGAPLQPIMKATPEKLYRARLQPGRSLDEIKNEDVRALVLNPEYTVVRNEIIDGELVRVFKQPDSFWRSLDMYFTGFVPTGEALSPVDVQANSWKLARWRGLRLKANMKSAWNPHGLEPDPTREELGFGDGIPFSIPEALPENCCGVVLHLWAMGGNDYERAVIKELTSRGWMVVDIKPGHTAMGDITPEALARIMVLEQERESLNDQVPKATQGESWASYTKRLEASPAHHRQTEISREVSDLRNPAIVLCHESDVDRVAAVIAGRIDASFARNCAAVRAVLETTRRVHPSVRGKPVVVMGFSAGALSTPTVAARLIPDVDAVVIVGGAANALGVATHSVISKGGIRLRCKDQPPSDELVRLLENGYLERTQLDAFQTAPLLADLPVLVVDAGMDTWVPSEYGEVLYERLGRPDRLHMSLGGHGFLFYFLPRRSVWIADWVNAAVAHKGDAQAAIKDPGVNPAKP